MTLPAVPGKRAASCRIGGLGMINYTGREHSGAATIFGAARESDQFPLPKPMR